MKPTSSKPAMKTITLDEAITLLSNCLAVYVDGGYVTFPNVVEEGDEDVVGEWLYLAVTEDSPRERFTEEMNKTVAIAESGEMILWNSKGQETRVMLLNAAPIL